MNYVPEHIRITGNPSRRRKDLQILRSYRDREELHEIRDAYYRGWTKDEIREEFQLPYRKLDSIIRFYNLKRPRKRRKK